MAKMRAGLEVYHGMSIVNIGKLIYRSVEGKFFLVALLQQKMQPEHTIKKLLSSHNSKDVILYLTPRPHHL